LLKKIALIVLLALILSSCSGKAPFFKNRGFYYWKTVFRLTDSDRKILGRMEVSTLYLRMFDVIYDTENKKTEPVNVVAFDNPQIGTINIIPVVFIMQDVFQKIRKNEIKKFAANIVRLAAGTLKNNNVSFSELQVDYDWTPGTKEAYFAFLKEIRADVLSINSSNRVSVTLRLHELKYKKETGVPPVDCVNIMAYNAADPRDYTAENTVFNLKDIRAYLNGVDGYPLPAGVILPFMTDYFVYNNGRLIKILALIDEKKLEDPNLFETLNSRTYMAKRGIIIGGVELLTGYEVKREDVANGDLKEGLNYIMKRIRLSGTLSIFHFDDGIFTGGSGEKNINDIISLCRCN
jgi:hypothetical protein